MSLFIIEPYYSGSHKYWADKLKHELPFDVELFTLPGRHWKWRMQGSAITLSKEINKSSEAPDCFIVSSMIDLACLKSLIKFEDIPYILYMHENQFTYPKSSKDKDSHFDLTYGYLNYKSALIADKVIFNSEYNKNEFIKSCSSLLTKMPDFNNLDSIKTIIEKSEVIPVGIDYEEIINAKPLLNNSQTPRLIWNHRWDEDKNPSDFYSLLKLLKVDNINFELILTASPIDQNNPIYQMVIKEFNNHIIYKGFLNSKLDYYSLLKSADIMPVSSKHEFQGLSVLEGFAAGLYPILPNSLVYPEYLNSPDHLHNNIEEYFYLTKNALNNSSFKSLSYVAKKFNWKKILKKYISVVNSFSN